MSFFLESPWTLGAIGGLLTALFFYKWLQAGQRHYLILLSTALFMTVGLVCLERVIVTDREAIKGVLDEAAANFVAGRHEAALEVIHPEATHLRNRVDGYLSHIEFHRLSVKDNLKAKVIRPPRGPATADVTFNLGMVVSSKKLGLSTQAAPRFVRLRMELVDGSWKILEFEHDSPQEGFKRQEDAD